MAAQLEKFSFITPTKPSKKDEDDSFPVVLLDDKQRSVSPDTIGDASEPAEEAEDDLEELRKKFVGEIDLPESEFLLVPVTCCVLIVTHRRGTSP